MVHDTVDEIDEQDVVNSNELLAAVTMDTRAAKDARFALMMLKHGGCRTEDLDKSLRDHILNKIGEHDRAWGHYFRRYRAAYPAMDPDSDLYQPGFVLQISAGEALATAMEEHTKCGDEELARDLQDVSDATAKANQRACFLSTRPEGQRKRKFAKKDCQMGEAGRVLARHHDLGFYHGTRNTTHEE